MDHGKRFMMNEGLLLLSYAYAVSGYSCAAAVFGIACAALAIHWHSARSALNNLLRILSWFVIRLPFLLSSGYSGDFGTIVLLAFCNTVVSLLWMESSFKALRPTMRVITGAFPLFLLGALTMPEPAASFLFGRPLMPLSALLLAGEIFLPVMLAYLRKSLRRKRRPISKEFIPRAGHDMAVYNTAYDKLAHSNLYPRSGKHLSS